MTSRELPDDPEKRVAARLGELRRERGLTLTALAEWTGISAAHLSRMEKGERQPSIGSLIQLARAYGVSLGELVGDERSHEHHVVRGATVPVHEGPDGPYAMMTGLGPRSALEAVRLELTADRPRHTASHSGEEWLYVVRGEIVARIGADEVTLTAGDALHFDAEARHSLWSRNGPATVLIVSVAPPSPRLPHGPA
ncbi:quercetin dioxygenase-like cupin family protein [Thermocatellispora tengchongensis]|uniref:Quercetin dioxygenase-like cupin family protein n=1 Tax=Thermocatellispora tengchongensis TaxID=1073253 RepID=A0A840NRQ1_9ACTN|nr:XRE family transcriptional regulator [Thermocatellispora tengchongensis]MBB5131314.1 quercetin dioxygenase-like cupin family protein [Thermocatellispora tengchongensis]